MQSHVPVEHMSKQLLSQGMGGAAGREDWGYPERKPSSSRGHAGQRKGCVFLLHNASRRGN